MALILDTNAFCAFIEGDETLLGALQNDPELALPTVVLGEYFYGISQSRRRATYETWLRTNLQLFDVLPIIEGTAESYSEIRRELKTAGRPIPTNDLWIAALARQHQMRLVTRDLHFRAIRGLHILTF
jgi:tRNA(fMet)-specific endonuclease VapC